MRVLVFDTETTGLPKTKVMNPDTLKLWPHIVQFSYVVYDTDENDIVESFDTIVKVKEDVIIPEESTKIHLITNKISMCDGRPIDIVFNNFFYQLRNVDLLVGHNVAFDINMITVELLRLIYDDTTISEEEMKDYKQNLHFLTNFKYIYCTLKESILLCNIKALNKFGKEYIKFPKLAELHQKLFESSPNKLHNSFNDILVTLRCFMKLKFDTDLNETCDKFMNIVKPIEIF
jgi:DNA polymerase III epsilon subunit-like protein